MNNKKNCTCCFFGHRKIIETDNLRDKLYIIVENLIQNEKITDFLFGSKSSFDDLCYEIVTKLKRKYPYIKRIYVRAEFPYINDDYKSYLLESYEETYYPERALNAGKTVYVERNFEMIEKSRFCIIYYNENYLPLRRKNSKRDLIDYRPKSGTKIAYEYAKKLNKEIILMWT